MKPPRASCARRLRGCLAFFTYPQLIDEIFIVVVSRTTANLLVS